MRRPISLPKLAAALAAALLAAGAAPLRAEEGSRLIHGARQLVGWEPVLQPGAELRLDGGGAAGAVRMRPARPAGIDYSFEQGRRDIALPVELDDCSELFGCNVHYAIHSRELRIEAASHDFDRDGLPELVFALGHPEQGVVVNVLKYVPARRGAQPGQWRLVGRMEGAGGRVELAGDSLLLPFSSLGLLDHWQLVQGRFVRLPP